MYTNSVFSSYNLKKLPFCVVSKKNDVLAENIDHINKE